MNKSEPDVAFGDVSVVFIDKLTPTAHGLLRFDEVFGNGPAKIPIGSPIVSATLTLNVENTGGATTLNRLRRSWSEVDTWNSLAEGISPDGIDAVSEPEATFVPSSLGVLKIPVTDSLQTWFDGAPNHGWVFLAEGWSFSSSEHADELVRPKLTVVSGPHSVAGSKKGDESNYC